MSGNPECDLLKAEENRMIRGYYKKRGQRGFSLVELIFIVLIVALLASIAIPQFVAYRTRAYNTAANVAVRSAYNASQAFFSTSPGGTVSVALLSVYGYNAANVSIVLTLGGTGKITNFTLQAIHSGGSSTFTVDEKGDITRG
jgi:type IV pilus assembly protein PilA